MSDGEKMAPSAGRKSRLPEGFGVLAVQSVICAVAILAVLIFRLVGGGLFARLKSDFEGAMRQNALAAAIHAMSGEDLYTTAATTVSTTAAKAVSAVPSVCPPLTAATLTSGFGERENPLTGERERHEGIDLAADKGAPVFAVLSGRVIRADAEGAGTLGRYLVMDCGGTEVWYAHCDTLTVAVGDVLTAGDPVATVGDTGEATGPHLHLEIRRNGEAVDPKTVLPEGLYD